MTAPRTLAEFTHDELARLVREYLLAGQLMDRAGMPHWLLASGWAYTGGGTGARTLLGVVASSGNTARPILADSDTVTSSTTTNW